MSPLTSGKTMDYLINVVIASKEYWMLALAVLALYAVIPNAFINAYLSDNEVVVYKKVVVRLVVGIAIIGTVVGIISPSNTYKLTTDYNKTADLKQLERLDESAALKPLVIQDISRQPKTAAARAETAVDMRKRTVTDQ